MLASFVDLTMAAGGCSVARGKVMALVEGTTCSASQALSEASEALERLQSLVRSTNAITLPVATEQPPAAIVKSTNDASMGPAAGGGSAADDHGGGCCGDAGEALAELRAAITKSQSATSVGSPVGPAAGGGGAEAHHGGGCCGDAGEALAGLRAAIIKSQSATSLVQSKTPDTGTPRFGETR